MNEEQLIIVNPNAGKRKGEKDWKQISAWFVKYDIPFKSELFKYLNNLSDTVHIISRLKLEKFDPLIYSDTIVKYVYTSNTKNKYEIFIKTKAFDHKNHNYIADTLWQDENKFYIMSNNIIAYCKSHI